MGSYLDSLPKEQRDALKKAACVEERHGAEAFAALRLIWADYNRTGLWSFSAESFCAIAFLMREFGEVA